METIFTISPFIIMAAFVFVFIESTYADSFSRRPFLRGIPVFKRVIDAGRLDKLFFNDKQLDTTEGVIRYLEDKTIFFRTDNDQPGFPNMTLIPVRATGIITGLNKLAVTGRIPVAIVVLFFCFASLPVLALIRDGSSPAILFLAGVLFLFGYGYTTQRKKLTRMIDTLEMLLLNDPWQDQT